MEPEKDGVNIEAEIKTRFLELPPALQDAITSADVDNRLREISESNKLHLDQGQKLENEVMLALLGIQGLDKLEENIKNEVGVPAETALALANDIAEKIFLPIREKLESELGPQEEGQPEDKPVAGSLEPGDKLEAGSLEPGAINQNSDSPVSATGYKLPATSSAILPATPPPPIKTERAIRAPVSESYMSQTPSHERKAIDGDPYREAVT